MSGVDGVQVRSGGQWQALLTYPGKLAIGATFDLAADQRGCILLCHFPPSLPLILYPVSWGRGSATTLIALVVGSVRVRQECGCKS